MPRRPIFLSLVVIGLFGCTSTQEQLGQVDERCDYDEQCQVTLVCRCVTYGQPDPEGNLEILSHGTNRGVAAAFDTGLRYATEISAPDDVIITIEGDGTNGLATLAPIIALMREGYDVVCGSRYIRGGAYVGFPLGRHVWSLGANLIMQWYCGLRPVKDYTLFYRGYRAALLQEAFQRYGRRFIAARCRRDEGVPFEQVRSAEGRTR